MTAKELKKLKRSELLELMVTQSKEIDRLKEELEATRKQLEERKLTIGKSGSIAEAALNVYHIFEEAQKAADLYLENAKRKIDEGQYDPGEPEAEGVIAK